MSSKEGQAKHSEAVGSASCAVPSLSLPVQEQLPCNDDPVPVYTASQNGGGAVVLDALRLEADGIDLPILSWPVWPVQEFSPKAYRIRTEIITSFYNSIKRDNIEAITAFITEGLVSPDVNDNSGATPLITAVNAGHVAVVRALLQLGADVNGYGNTDCGLDKVRRTPLQVAAESGNLVLTKLLVEEFGADDSLVAPDGQLALRLAVENQHHEVIAYLPPRRGGEFRRWELHHELAIKRAKRAAEGLGFALKCIFWSLPKTIVWWMPKYCVAIPLHRITKWAWETRKKFRGWCKSQVMKFPGRVKKVAKGLWKGAKQIPRAVKKMSEAIWKLLKAIPSAVKDICIFVWRVIKALVRAMASIAKRTASLLHTLTVAIVTFFRNLTLQDIWRGVCDILSAVFVTVPKVVWSSIREAGEVSYKFVVAVLGNIGRLVWIIATGILWLAMWIPSKLVEILVSVGSSFAQGAHEIMVWINPKA